ncbi:MAG: rRNA adenine N-6-methyltransferase family protein [Syntrophales bacterium]|nr:rRNA adenine N-6-methyltransferase family protein [Syntrophales bacterium]
MKTLVYIRNLLADRYVASITPSSKSAVERICRKINFKAKNLIIEYGPGLGVFTSRFLEYMSPESRLIAIERDPDFHRLLRREIDDPRLLVHLGCAGSVLDVLHGVNGEGADYIVSGIPFSLLSGQMRAGIISNTFSALKNGGSFLAYQTFYQPDRHLKSLLKEHFPVVRTELVLPCIPPLSIIEAKKE